MAPLILEAPRNILNILLATFWPSSPLLPRIDHYAPHEQAGFEGYYTRTLLSNNATLAIIFCWVKNAKTRPNLIHISYTTPDGKGWKYEFFPDKMDKIVGEQDEQTGLRTFEFRCAEVGTMRVTPTKTTYTIRHPSLTLDLEVTNRTPWSSDDPLSGPEGPIVQTDRLLPLHWFVYSTRSKATYTIKHGDEQALSGDNGVAHQEKNWGESFPSGWIWAQAFSSPKADTTTNPASQTSICLAGGNLLGMSAYLIGYRSSKLSWTFLPPFSFGWQDRGPSLYVDRSSANGNFNITTSTPFRSLVIKAHGPPGTYIDLAAPLSDGHEPGFCIESFGGRMRVEAWERDWPWGAWRLVESGEVGEAGTAAVEFGGAYWAERDKPKLQSNDDKED
ncbi:hypothetical protein YB2330_000759 [Saitoella coloradoensis]